MNNEQFNKFDKILISDIDNTLIGDDKALIELQSIIKQANFNLGFVTASGRNVESSIDVLDSNDFIKPNIIISSVGSEIYFRKEDNTYKKLEEWVNILSDGWNRDIIVNILKDVSNLEYQNETEQKEHKISYHINEKSELQKINNILNKLEFDVKIIPSKNKDLDILPKNSGKGEAVKFLLNHLNLPLSSSLVAGDSGNDKDMLTIGSPAVVVANYSEELTELRKQENIYFAENKYAAGIIEGIEHFDFLGNNKYL